MTTSEDHGEYTDTQRRMRRCDPNTDFISNLPEDIIGNILTRLPIQYAVRTCLLSKNWRSKWISNPISQALLFDDDYFMFCKRKLSKTTPEIWSHLYRVLSVYKGPVQKFVLHVPYEMDVKSYFVDEKESKSYFVDQMMCLLSGMDIQELYLASSCKIRLPPEFTGFKQLISIELSRVNISAYDFNTLISKCPLLERLTVDLEYGKQPLEIDASNLKFFKCGYPGHILFKNVPSLSMVIITWCGFFSRRSSSIVKVFGSLLSIEHLCACRNFVKQLCEGGIPETLPKNLEHLRSLELFGLCYNSLNEIQCTLLLMKSSPNIQKLKIKAAYNPVNEKPVLAILNTLSLFDNSFKQLEEVMLLNIYGTIHELEFLKLILAKSLALKKIVIQLPKAFTSAKEHKMRKAVTRLQMASPNAEIIFEYES